MILYFLTSDPCGKENTFQFCHSRLFLRCEISHFLVFGVW